jgi:hypothetical protein
MNIEIYNSTKIVIPSYDRYEDFKTIKFLEKNNIPKECIYIFVSTDEQKEKYINCIGKDYNIIVGILGLVNQRNFITNYFDENEILICMDDDIDDLIHCENKPLIEWLYECINFLNNSEYGLLSISPSINPFYFEQRITSKNIFSISNNYCVGAFYILKNDKNIILNKNILLEDWERSLLFQQKYGKNIIYKSILIKTKYFAKNGLSHERTKYNYLSSINKLIYNFSDILSFTYKKLPLDKYIDFPNLRFEKKVKFDDVIQLPKIEPSELNVLYCMLENINISPRGEKSNRRGFPLHHRSATFGYTRARYKTRLNGNLYDISAYSLKYPEIYNELLRIGNIYCPFEFDAIHVNKNVVCPAHKDSKNVGKSMLLSFGDYTGCNIVVEDKIYDTNCNPVIFDGSDLIHYNTNDLQGTKYSLVFFNSEMSDKVNKV